MPGISVKLPLSIDDQDGPYVLHKGIKSMIKQNLKMLIMTIPGERIMDPSFGVGPQRFLFENDTVELRAKLSERISRQVRRYMPFLKVKEAILPNFSETAPGLQQKIHISIRYSIEDLAEEDVLNISLSPYDSGENVF